MSGAKIIKGLTEALDREREAAAYERVWAAIQLSDELTPIRRKLSIHELRTFIVTVVTAARERETEEIREAIADMGRQVLVQTGEDHGTIVEDRRRP